MRFFAFGDLARFRYVLVWLGYSSMGQGAIMKVERLCGWHGIGLYVRVQGVYLVLGRVMFIWYRQS